MTDNLARTLFIIALLAVSSVLVALRLDTVTPNVPATAATADATADLPDAPDDPTPRVPRDSVEAAPPPLHVKSRFQQGDHKRYSYTSDHTLVFSSNESAEKGTGVLSLKGEYRTTVVANDRHQVLLHAELRRPGFTVTPSTEAALIASTQKALGTPFYVVLTPSGAVRGIYAPQDIPARAKTFLKGIAASFQLVEGNNRSEWTRRESDVQGRFDARYVTHGDTRVRKTKLAYRAFASAHGLASAEDVSQHGHTVSGGVDFTLADDGTVEGLKVDETVRMTPDSTLSVEVRTTASARLLEATHLADAGRRLARPADFVFYPITDSERLASDQADSEHRRLSRLVLADVLSVLQALSGDRAKIQDRAMVTHDLTLLFRVRPGDAIAAGRAILAGDLAADAKASVIGALSGAGTPEAQQALAALLGADDLDPDARLQATMGLALTDAPTPTAVAAIRDAFNDADPDVARSALLAAGALSRTQAREGAEPALLGELVGSLQHADTTDTLVHRLKALGNSGAPEVLAEVSPYLNDPREVVRTAAIRSLRFVAGDQADRLLAAALTGAPSPSEAGAALYAIAFRDDRGTFLPALGDVLGSAGQHEVSTRLLVVDFLGTHQNALVGAADLLQLATADPSDDVAAAASTFLAETPVPAPAGG